MGGLLQRPFVIASNTSPPACVPVQRPRVIVRNVHNVCDTDREDFLFLSNVFAAPVKADELIFFVLLLRCDAGPRRAAVRYRYTVAGGNVGICAIAEIDWI